MKVYFASSLPAIEIPAYRERLRETKPDIAQKAERAPPQTMVRLMESDRAFMKDLRAGAVIGSKHPKYAQWKEDRGKFDAALGQLSWRKYGFTPADATLLTAFTSMFLHGDLMHLLGNMVFLFIVGVAVESALGGGWMLLLYLASGLCGNALHYLVASTSTIPSVGASGAIAGLMGLFTVVYGLRNVNFFYWLVFMFGFKAMRGIVVLPIWVAWEFIQFAVARGSPVNYMAHAGGLISGAALGFLVLKRFSGQRVEAFHGEREQEKLDKAEYERARSLAAKADFKAASTVFGRLAARFPQPDLLQQWHTVAKHDPAHDDYHRAVNALLSFAKPDRAMRAVQRDVFNEYLGKARAPRLGPKTLAIAGLNFARGGYIGEAERAAELLLKSAPDEPGLPVIWDALAHALSTPPGDEERLKKAKRYRMLITAHARARAPATRA